MWICDAGFVVPWTWGVALGATLGPRFALEGTVDLSILARVHGQFLVLDLYGAEASVGLVAPLRFR